MNKTKILILIILFLFITNVVTIISGLVFTSASKITGESDVESSARERVSFYRDQLGLSRTQRNDFIMINRNYNRGARQITADIENLRYRLIDEMAAGNPDREKLDTLCNNIGMLHTRLKKSTVDYYLSMKGLCSDEQQARLHELFMGMADPRTDMNTFRNARGIQRGMRRGRGMMRMDNDNNAARPLNER